MLKYWVIMIGRYCLRITRKDGTVSKHYYDDYDDLDYNATFCQFSTNILHAEGLERKFFKWNELFRIG